MQINFNNTAPKATESYSLSNGYKPVVVGAQLFK